MRAIAAPGAMASQGATREIGLGIGKHAAPAGFGRCKAKPEKGKTGLGQDGEPELDGHLHDDVAGDVRQDMFEGDARIALAGAAGGEDVIAGENAQGRATGDAGEDRYHEDRDGQDGVRHAGAEKRPEHHRRKDRREGEDDVHRPHDEAVEPSALGSGGEAEERARGGTERDGDGGDDQRVSGADHQQRGDIAAELVGAEKAALPVAVSASTGC